MNKLYLIAIPVVVLALVAGIVGGVLYQKNQGGNKGQYQNFQRGQMMNGVRDQGNFARPVSGEIVALDDKSMTVKLTDGSTKIVILSDTTKYSKSQDVTKRCNKGRC